MGDFKIYDSNEVSVLACGIPVDGGFGEDTFVEIDQPNALFETKVGADGSVTRNKTNDRRGTVKITLMQSSAANALLSAIHNIDLRASNGAGVGPLLIKDNGGTSLYAAEKSWVSKPPAVTFAKGVEMRVWEIECAELERFDGGN